MKASLLFRQNVEALLRARHQTRHDLAFFCRRTDAWLSKILGKDERNIPMKYLDRIADFFGLSVYQLFQPGISPLTERRRGIERRVGKDRRASIAASGGPPLMTAADIALTAEDVALLLRIKTLTRRDRAELEAMAREAGKIRRKKGASNTTPNGVAEMSGRGPSGQSPPIRAAGGD